MKNTLSVLVLQSHSVEAADTGKNVRDVAKKLIHNPIIVSAAAGMLVPPFQIPLPGELQRFLGILSGLVFFGLRTV